MKKLLISLAIISLACSCANDTFTIKGNFTLNEGVSETYIVLNDYFTDEKDSTLVSLSGDFTYKTEADVQTIKEIFLMEDGITQEDAILKVIPEAATITVDLDIQPTSKEAFSTRNWLLTPNNTMSFTMSMKKRLQNIVQPFPVQS